MKQEKLYSYLFTNDEILESVLFVIPPNLYLSLFWEANQFIEHLLELSLYDPLEIKLTK